MNQTLKILEFNKVVKILSEYAISAIGKEKSLSIKPMIHAEKIQHALYETSEAVKIILEKGKIPLDGLTDIRLFIKKAAIGSVLSLGELLKVAQVLKVGERVKSYMKEERNQDNSYVLINNVTNKLVELPGLTKEIYSVIVSEEEISDHASPELYKIRRQITQKNKAIRDKLNKMIHSSYYQNFLQETIVTLRGERFVVPVKQEYRNNIPGLVHDQSSSKATLFIEPMSIVEMNNDLKTLKTNEKQEMERILMEFTNIIGNNATTINNNIELLIQLDLIFAKGSYSLDINGSEPILNEKGYIQFNQARHPLIPKDTVVASDICLGKDFNSLLITGPNTGGKTITLKTIGLLCLMAQSGLHIPVKDGSEIGVFDKIFADIGDEQSIEQSLSTFSSHMTNIVEILKKADKNSLVLFDELGAGTDPTEGAALAMAILDYLHKKKVKTVATTHYSELKEYALSTEGIENASVEFDIETLKPTYVLLIGIPGKSNAFEISKRLGLQEEVINSAKGYISQENIRFEDVLLDIENKRKQIEEDETNAKKDKIEIQKTKNKIKEEEVKLEEYKEKMIRKSKEEALNIIKDTKKQSDELIKELKALKEERNQNTTNKTIEETKKKLRSYENSIKEELYKSSIPRKSHTSPKDLKQGESVHITTLNQNGFVLSAPDEKNEAQVQVGIMKVNVHVSNITRLQAEEGKHQQKTNISIKNRTMNISPTLDLRGKMTEEAIFITDKYLDDVYVSNLNIATIIHGKGTGALRKSIHVLLKNHIHVQEFRIGRHNEGGEGVTIVAIK